MKIAINKCYGGFSLSPAAIYAYARIKGLTLHEDRKYEYSTIYYTSPPDFETGKYPEDSYFSDSDIPRNDPALIETIEELGSEANGNLASLKVVEIPDDVDWKIDEYDGIEWVAEKHKTWN